MLKPQVDLLRMRLVIRFAPAKLLTLREDGDGKKKRTTQDSPAAKKQRSRKDSKKDKKKSRSEKN
jgi:hypothetical protein